MGKPFSAFVGFDGFIDHILVAVDRRLGAGNHFVKIEKIQQFAERIANAAGKSTNIELFPIEQRIGGNGPILSQTLAHWSVDVHLVGAFGRPMNPVFKHLSRNITAVSIGQPGVTHAIEFSDGKLLLGIMSALDAIDLKTVRPVLEEHYAQYSRCDVFCFTNWTMIIHLNEILDFFWEKLVVDRAKIVFFDLADPEKRLTEDIQAVLACMRRYTSKCYTILGLNLKEAEQIAGLLGYDFPQKSRPSPLVDLCVFIQKHVQIDEVFIHDTTCCVAVTSAQSAFVDGFFVEHPKTTTGAGDHFNAGYLFAKLQQKSLQEALTQAYRISSHFVKTGMCLDLKML